jgi:hypothetical protein
MLEASGVRVVPVPYFVWQDVYSEKDTSAAELLLVKLMHEAVS